MASDHILYSFRRCPYAIRARLALAVGETSHTLREVHLARKPSAMLEVSAKGTVPVLVLASGEVIDESMSIMRWTLEQNDPEQWLDREDPDLIARNDGDFKHDLDRYKYPDRYHADAVAHRESGLAFLRLLDARLSVSGQLCGTKRGLTDAAIMPFVRQFAAVDLQTFASLPLPNLQRWLAEHLASQLFSAVMTRLRPWAPGDLNVMFAGLSGKPDEAVPG